MRSRAEELRARAEQAAAAEGSRPDDQEPASNAPEAGEQTFGLGEVVWAREKGWPAWPSVVITLESARDLSPLSEPSLPALLGPRNYDLCVSHAALTLHACQLAVKCKKG